MKNLEYFFKKANKEGWAMPQFNFSDFTQLKGIVQKCAELKAPAILGTSEGESKFFGLEEAVALRDILRKKTGAAVFLNLDHGKSFEYLKQAMDAGYDMVHFDGSKLPVQENIKITKKVKNYAKRRGVVVEGEMGVLGTESSKIYTEKFEIKEENLTKPEEAQDYVKKTGVDLLAVSIGNFHGIEVSGIDPNLRLDLLEKIKQAVGSKAMLVLHGGSGTPEDDIKESIKLGIVKININTEIRLAFSGNLRKSLAENNEEVVPYKFMPKAKAAVAAVVGYKINLFGSAGKA